MVIDQPHSCSCSFARMFHRALLCCCNAGERREAIIYTRCLRQIGLILNETIIAFKACVAYTHIHLSEPNENKQLKEFIWLRVRRRETELVCVHVNIYAEKQPKPWEKSKYGWESKQKPLLLVESVGCWSHIIIGKALLVLYVHKTNKFSIHTTHNT